MTRRILGDLFAMVWLAVTLAVVALAYVGVLP